MKDIILDHFKRGEFNVSLIAQHIDKGRAATWKFINKEPELQKLYKAHREVQRKRIDKEKSLMIKHADKHGLRAAATKYNTNVKRVQRIVYEHREGVKILHAAKAKDNASGFYQPKFYY